MAREGLLNGCDNAISSAPTASDCQVIRGQRADFEFKKDDSTPERQLPSSEHVIICEVDAGTLALSRACLVPLGPSTKKRNGTPGSARGRER